MKIKKNYTNIKELNKAEEKDIIIEPLFQSIRVVCAVVVEEKRWNG